MTHGRIKKSTAVQNGCFLMYRVQNVIRIYKMKIECYKCNRKLKVVDGFFKSIHLMIIILQKLQNKGWSIDVDEPSYEHDWNMAFVCSKCKVKDDLHARINS